MKIAIAGMGYVGLSQAVLLAQHNAVCVVDVVAEKVAMLNRGISPIQDSYMGSYLKEKNLQLRATMEAEEAYSEAEYVIIAVPTNFEPEENAFDTTAVESVICQVLHDAPNATIVIKSTVPVGFTQRMRSKYAADNILVSPEFLREGKALYDNLYPSRIIVGADISDPRLTERARTFAGLLRDGAEKKDVEILVTSCGEAEAIKLFANTYLALRISFFNELDTFAELRGLDTGTIIRGICQDPRIGQYYNNPSFGYGGYCLPKDTRQLLASYCNIPQTLIKAVVSSNRCRKEFIARQICRRVDELIARGNCQPAVGIYRLAMKSGSDNFRCSAIFDVVEQLRETGVQMLLYEPTLAPGQTVSGCRRVDDLPRFKSLSSLIVANRMDSQLIDVQEKVYTRDIFGRD